MAPILVVLETGFFTLNILLELAGAVIIGYCALNIFFRFFQLKYIEPSTRIRLRFARSMALGLEFLLAGEIIRTVSVRHLEDLMIIAVLVILRGFITFIIHWEMDHDSRLAQME